jgi:hypothetical protein
METPMVVTGGQDVSADEAVCASQDTDHAGRHIDRLLLKKLPVMT